LEFISKVIRSSLPILGTLLLVACGGGGGDDNNSPPPPPAPTNLSYANPPVLTVGTAMTAVTPTVGGSPTAFAIAPALPAGLALNGTTGTISGTPTATQVATNHVVTASNAGGNTTATVAITVIAVVPSITYPNASYTFSTNVPVRTVTPTVTGGAVTSWSIDHALPAGLTFSTTTGVISGTPTQVATASDYIVTAQNSGGSDTFTVSIAAQSAVLMEFGHWAPVEEIVHNGSRILSRDAGGNVSLFNEQTGEKLLAASTGCGSCDNGPPNRLALNGTVAFVRTVEAFEMYSADNGELLGRIDANSNNYNYWGFAPDGTYLWATNFEGLHVWSSDGTLLVRRTSDAYRSPKIVGVAGALRVAGGPAAPTGVETISIPGGVSTFSSGSFAGNGIFHSWFADGQRFLTIAGNSLWVYSADGVQEDFRQLPTLTGLAGRGNRFWTFAGNTLDIYSVGPSSTPLATFAFGGAPGRLVPAADTLLGFVNTTNQLSVVDLEPATPTRTNYTVPIVARTYGAASASDWAIGDGVGLMISEPGAGGAEPVRYSIGPALALTGGAAHVAVVTSLGTTRIYDTATRALITEMNLVPTRIQMSADGTVFAVRAGSVLTIYSLPSLDVLATYDFSASGNSLYAFRLSESGEFLTLIVETAFAEYTRSVIRIDGTPVWSDNISWNDALTPGPFPMPQLSPDGTTIALPPTIVSDTSGSDIIRNGTLLTTVVGFASSWLTNDRLLVHQNDSSGGQWTIGSCEIVVLGATPLTCFRPAWFAFQPASPTAVYVPEFDAIIDLLSGATLWHPVRATDPIGMGSLAGNSVVFAQDTQVRIEPR
jgi:hypothetical protein